MSDHCMMVLLTLINPQGLSSSKGNPFIGFVGTTSGVLRVDSDGKCEDLFEVSNGVHCMLLGEDGGE